MMTRTWQLLAEVLGGDGSGQLSIKRMNVDNSRQSNNPSPDLSDFAATRALRQKYDSSISNHPPIRPPLELTRPEVSDVDPTDFEMYRDINKDSWHSMLVGDDGDD